MYTIQKFIQWKKRNKAIQRKQKTLKKWAVVLENLKITDEDKINWMTGYAELQENQTEQVRRTAVAPIITGDGDKPQTLLPIAMRVAAQTIGTDLVSVQPIGGIMESKEEKIKRERVNQARERYKKLQGAI